jgi:RecA-family ATPase
MADIEEIKEALQYIDPVHLDYSEWLQIGMALKDAGATCDIWDSWSRRDSARYVQGETWNKWVSFQDSGITEKTLFKMAMDHGYKNTSDYGGHALNWNDEIYDVDYVVDRSWLERDDIKFPNKSTWQPIKEIETYLTTLFNNEDYVGYCVKSRELENGKLIPYDSGNYSRTCGQLLEELHKTKDIGATFGDYNNKAGAWIRFNPLDGTGVKDKNVSEYRYALIESDNMDIGVQSALLRKLELPIAVMMYSGNKSIHAIVRVDALNEIQYKKRVDYLYGICKKNGFDLDKANKNPSRLSRFPGFERNGNYQFIIDTNIGKGSWEEWEEYIEDISDNLPEFENLETLLQNPPQLADELIEGVLRTGHKMLISGASKTSKSFMLIELAYAIAEGMNWMGKRCKQGKVLYVNLEVDRASCINRISEVYKAFGMSSENHSSNIDIWNLRGHATTMEKLAPKLIRRCEKQGYIAVIIDPIYKVMNGDENKAGDMAAFCNQFDAIANALNCSVIYCHHFSKGFQGGKKSIDRASGSGVFARDPDAILTVTELDVPESLVEANGIPLRIEYTLREFKPLEPTDVWNRYPIHYVDYDGILSEYEPPSVDGEKAKMAQKNAEKRQSAEMIEFTNAYEKLSEKVTNGTLEYVSVAEMMKELKIKSKKTFMKKAENLDVFDFEKRTNQLGGDASEMVLMVKS